MSEFEKRQLQLKHKLESEGWDGYLVTQNVDLYYFTGSFQNGYLFVPVEGDSIFYVRKSYERAKEEAYGRVKPLGSFRQFGSRLEEDFKAIFGKKTELNIATEFDVLPTQDYIKLHSLLPRVRWNNGSKLIREIRMIKSEQEVRAITHAAKVLDQTLTHIWDDLKPGVTENEWMAKIEYDLRLAGHSGKMRSRGYNQEIISGMLGSGAVAAVPTYFDGPAGGNGLGKAHPYGASYKVIQRGEPILFDIGCCIDGYVIDQTRTIVIGQLEARLMKAYDVSEHILKSVEERLKPGVMCEDLYAYALKLAGEAGLAQHFMGYGSDQVKFLGHGIGLEIDEFPVLAKGFRYPLEAGMVIAIEPKFTFPGEGVVGIEDTYLITEQGFTRLTQTKQALIQL